MTKLLGGMRVITAEMIHDNVPYGYVGSIYPDGTCSVYYYKCGRKIIFTTNIKNIQIIK